MKRTIAIVALTIGTAVGLQAQKRWTLDDCLQYAMQNNITLQKARLQQQAAAEEVKGSKGALLPTLSASTNQSLGYNPWQDSGITTVTNGQVSTKIDKVYYNGSYGVNAQWTVWDGGRLRDNLRLSQLASQQADLTVAEQCNSIQERIAQLYVQCLYLDEAIRVNQSSLETSVQNEQRGQEMVDVGKMSRADLAQLTAQRATSEYGVVEAQTQLANYKMQLRQLLELSADEAFDIVAPTTTDEQALADIPALQTVYEQALASRPEIENAHVAIESSKLSTKVAEAGWMPQVSLTGGVSTSTNSRSNNGWGTQMKTNFNMAGGVSVSIPIFDGRQTKTAVSRARIQEQQALLDLQDQQETLYQTIEQYWLDAQTNQQKFRAAMSTVKSEQQSYELLSEQFRLGLKNIVELMTGKDQLLQAQQNQLQAKYLTILNMQMLRFYEGSALYEK